MTKYDVGGLTVLYSRVHSGNATAIGDFLLDPQPAFVRTTRGTKGTGKIRRAVFLAVENSPELARLFDRLVGADVAVSAFSPLTCRQMQLGEGAKLEATVIVNPSPCGVAALARFLNFEWYGQYRDLGAFAGAAGVLGDPFSEDGENLRRLFSFLPAEDDPSFEDVLAKAVWLFLPSTTRVGATKMRSVSIRDLDKWFVQRAESSLV